MTVTVSAPGKLILTGEHSVVFGKPAILTAINRRLYVTIKKSQSTNIRNPFIQKILSIFQQKSAKRKIPPLCISIKSQIPIGVGLGSSAALSVSLMAALSKYINDLWHPQKINEYAYEAEKVKHKNPSGADNTIVTFGGLLWYRKEFEFLKQIWSLPKLSYQLPKLLLINTGKPEESTGEMVAKVQKLYQKNPAKVSQIFLDQEKKTKEFLLALKNGEFEKIKDGITQSQRNLENLGVVGKLAQRLIKLIEKSGGAGKISGAGGTKEASGIILAIHKDMKVLEEIAQNQKCEYYSINTGEEGVKIENNLTI